MYTPPLLTQIAINISTTRYFGPLLGVIGFALVYPTFWVLVWLGLGPASAISLSVIVLLALPVVGGMLIKRHVERREREAARREEDQQRAKEAAVDAAFQNALREWDERRGGSSEMPRPMVADPSSRLVAR
jgi:membrane protein implicated in regulation of membrane protease activity